MITASEVYELSNLAAGWLFLVASAVCAVYLWHRRHQIDDHEGRFFDVNTWLYREQGAFVLMLIFFPNGLTRMWFWFTRWVANTGAVEPCKCVPQVAQDYFWIVPSITLATALGVLLFIKVFSPPRWGVPFTGSRYTVAPAWTSAISTVVLVVLVWAAR